MNKVKLLIIIAIPLLVGFSVFLYLRSIIFLPADSKNKELVLFEIIPEKTFRSVAQEMEAQKLIKSYRALDILARARGLDTQIKAGEYELSPSMTPKEILNKIASGDVFKRTVIVKEGTSVWEIASLLQKAGLSAAATFNDALNNLELLREAGIRAQSFEGYLFPDTYNFSKSDSVKTIIWKMLERGDKVWDVDAMKAAEKLRMTRHEVLTLASIIEKESGNVAEQPTVSSVFLNRLSKGMKLQADPTVIYGITDYKGVITQEMLLRVHPYNTYINFGLPPGPICNPGATAIKAALNPVQTNYLYFVADGKGGHIFSENLDQHNVAVQNYRKTLKEAKQVEAPQDNQAPIAIPQIAGAAEAAP